MPKVLIIEDEDILLDVLSKKIKNKGYEVIISRDGEEGLAQIRSGKPDLILLDMVMPKMTGYDVLQVMKDENIRIPVIIISNSGQPVDVGKAMKLGARDYVVKAELDPDEIFEKLEYCLKGGQSGYKGLSGSGPQTPGAKPGDGDRRKEKAAAEGGGGILVAEDDMFLRELCVKKLAKAGFKVIEAADGIEAYEKIISHRPDLVLLDVIMPGIEGFEVLKRVRGYSDKSIANVPIIVLSNLGQDTDTQKGIELGANDYLIKANFTMEDIVKKIRNYLK